MSGAGISTYDRLEMPRRNSHLILCHAFFVTMFKDTKCMKTRNFATLAAVTATLFATACASNDAPTMGDTISASNFGSLSGDWEKASKAETDAARAERDADKRLDKAKDDLKDARKDADRAEDQIKRAESDLEKARARTAAAQAERMDVEARYKAIVANGEAS